jgi:hypothetical protein
MAKGSNSRARPTVAGVAVALLLIAGVIGFRTWQSRTGADAGGNAADVSLTQDPALYQGDTRQAYTVARDHPDLLAQLDCYCGCEEHEGHKNLLDCFRTNHGAVCDICMGEAVTAGEMLGRGTPVDQIREALRARYGHGG